MSNLHDPMIGRTIRGSIKIVRRIGEGGMGFVYEAYQEHLERRLALKIMTPEHARNPLAAEYFLREAKSVAKLRHPNIIQIIDFGKDGDDTLFLAMEFVPGSLLTDILVDEFPLQKELIIDLMQQTLSGLEEAHAHHIIHRDLKPDNLMIERTRSGKNQVKILDFGIAHLRDNESKGGVLTQQGAILGTPQYMSPEQARGERVDARSDLFAMGTILYEMLTNLLPFTGDNMPEILMRVMTHNPVPPSALCRDVDIDPELETICLRALHKEKDLRYQTAREFREALERVKNNNAQQTSAPAAKFIFKRPKSATKQPSLTTEVDPPRPSQLPVAPPQKLAEPNLKEHSDAMMVNVSDLFGQPLSEPSQANTVLTQRDTQGMEPPSTSPPFQPSDSLGLNVQDLRDDLLGEKKHAAILVIHQRIKSQLDAETLVETHDKLEHIINAIDPQWGAQLHSRQGGYTTLLIGYDRPSSEDHMRAANLAISLRNTLAQAISSSVQFAFALAYGELFAPKQRIERADGPALSEATELARNAQDNTILIAGQNLAQKLEQGFEIQDDDRAPQLISLRSTPYTSQNTHTTQSPKDANQPALIGRDIETASMLRCINNTLRGQGGTCQLFGDGGSGKTALLKHMCALAKERQIPAFYTRKLYSGAQGVREILTQWTHQALQHLGVSQDQSVATQLEAHGLEQECALLLEGLLTDDLNAVIGYQGGVNALQPEANTELAIEASLRKLLTLIAKDNGLILILDEINELDAPLSQLCERLATYLQLTSVLTCFGLRTEPIQSIEDATKIHVRPLDDSSAVVLLRNLLGQDKISVEPAKLTQIIKYTHGNPLQIKTVSTIIKENPETSLDDILQSLAQSNDINTLMRLRLNSLPSSAQNILAVLAVLGDATEASMLRSLSSQSWDPEQTLQVLYDRGFIDVEAHDQGARLFFVPSALGWVAYQNLSRKNRLRIHDRAAVYLHTKLQKEHALSNTERRALAKHFAAMERHDLAISHLSLLYTQAFQSFQYQDAQELLHLIEQNASKLTSFDYQQKQRYALDHVRLIAAQNELQNALQIAVKLDRDPKINPPLSYEVRIELARLWLQQEDPSTLDQMLQQLTQTLLSELSSKPNLAWMLIRAMTLLAETKEKLGHITQATQTLLDTVELIERYQPVLQDPQNNPVGASLFWEPLNQLGRIRLKDHDTQGAQKMFTVALQHIQRADDRLGEMTVRGNLATLLSMQNDGDAALHEIDRALQIARQAGQLVGVAKLLFNQGLVHLRSRDRLKAKTAFTESQHICKELDWREGLAMTVYQLRSLGD